MSQIQTKFIADLAVTNAKLAQIPAHSYLGNNTGSTANAADITSTQLTADLNLFSSSLQGLVPASGGGTTNFLRADGTFAAPTGTGGTVTSVALAAPALFTVSGSPVTTSGTLTLSYSGTALPIANGGTAATTAAAAFVNLSPLTTAGDLIFENATPAPARLPIGSTGQLLTVVGGLPAWATLTTDVTTIGTFNSQTSQANGLFISGNTLYAQAATTTNPGMVIVPAAGGLALSTASLSINTDGSTVKVNGSNALESIQPNEERITLSGTNITNQYVDLAHVAFGSSASANSVTLFPNGGPMQLKTVDYTVSLTGGSGGVTRVTFAGDLATGGGAALVASDILVIDYSYLA